jgi:DnaK suppressor protein
MENVQSAAVAGLTAEQLRVLEERLQTQRSQLMARQGSEQAVGLSGEPAPSEPLEAAEQTRVQEDALLASDRDRLLLAEVEHALRKIADGAYGVSETSGQPIGFRRLLAVPWARLTVEEEDEEA